MSDKDLHDAGRRAAAERISGKKQFTGGYLSGIAGREEPTGYRAFYVAPGKDRQLRLDVRLKDGSGLLLPYGHIIPIRYEGESLISLLCTGMAVTIEGRNLRPLIDALQRENALYVQEWDGSDMAEPDGAVIDRITVQQGE